MLEIVDTQNDYCTHVQVETDFTSCIFARDVQRNKISVDAPECNYEADVVCGFTVRPGLTSRAVQCTPSNQQNSFHQVR